VSRLKKAHFCNLSNSHLSDAATSLTPNPGCCWDKTRADGTQEYRPSHPNKFYIRSYKKQTTDEAMQKPSNAGFGID